MDNKKVETDEEPQKRYLLIWEREFYNQDNYLSYDTEYDVDLYGDEGFKKFVGLRSRELAEGRPSVSDIQFYEVKEVFIDEDMNKEIVRAVAARKAEIEEEKKIKAARIKAIQKKNDEREYKRLKKRLNK